MAHDFKRKEPNKTEKVLYELFIQQQSLERNLATNSALLVIIAQLMKIDPEKLGEMLVNGNDQIKEFSEKINATIHKLEDERKSKQPETPAAEIPDEHAGHNHA